MASRIKFLTWAIFTAALAAVSICRAAETEDRTKFYPSLPFASEYGGLFKLTTHDGRVVTNRDFMGGYVLLYFGYTSCADICPTTLHRVSAALNQLGSAAERIVPLFINLDAEQISLDNLQQYVHFFHPSFIGLTGTAAEIRVAAGSYRVRYHSATKGDGSKVIIHSGKIFLLGPDGRVIEYYPHEAPVEWLVTSVAHHIQKGTGTGLSSQ